MPLTLNCACGKLLRVADEHAGRRIKCPACNAIIAPPAPEPQVDVVEDEPKRAPTAKPVARPSHDEDEDDNGGYGMNPAVNTADKPRKKPRSRRRAHADVYEDDYPPARRRSGGSSGISPAAGRRMVYAVCGIVLTVLGIGAVYGGTARGSVFGVCVAMGGLIMIGRVLTNNMPDNY